MLPTGPQPPLGIHLLGCEVLQELQMELCSTTDLHGLWVDSLPHNGLHHELQGNRSSAPTITQPCHAVDPSWSTLHVKGAG